MCNNHKRTYGIELEGYTTIDIRGDHVDNFNLIDDGSLHDDNGECEYCNGNGRTEERCEYCSGYGAEDCSECNGRGEVDCPECDGRHEWECSECDGTGEKENGEICEHCEDGWIHCDDCYSNGQVDCEYCVNGSISCEHCDGEGYFDERCEECDGSGTCGNGDQYGVECVSHILNEGEYEAIDEIFDYTDNYGWYVNGDCGTHVHIGCDDLEPKDLSKLTILMNIVEPFIYGSLPVERWYGSYAKKTIKGMVEYLIDKGGDITLQEIANRYYGEHTNLNRRFTKYEHVRYHGLNLHSWFYRKTIEFRYFDGAEDSEQAKKWIQLCIKLVDFAKHTSFEQLLYIGKELSMIENHTILADKIKEMLDLEYNFSSLGNSAYGYSKENLAIQFTTTSIESQAV